MKNQKTSIVTELERHSGIIRIALILLSEDEINFQSFINTYGISPTTLYRTLNKAKEIGLIKTRVDKSSYPYRNMISLTEKGKKVAEKLKEIEETLKE